MADVADLTVYDDDESDIIAWPSDRRGRVINWRMTPGRAAMLAAALELLVDHEPDLWQQWFPEVEGLREAVRRSQPHRRPFPAPFPRRPDPLPRVPVAGTLPPDRTRDPSREARP
jgi:hypothetical protein